MYKKIASLLLIAIPILATADVIETDSTSRSTSETTVKSPPPTAVAPAVTSINNDVCVVGASGAVQTQVLGMSFGSTTRDMNCERIKLAKNLFDMGMKVAAVATLCQDERVFQAMLDAGTPCPVDGKIGAQAKEVWILKGRIKQEHVELNEPTKSEQKHKFNCPGYSGDDEFVAARVCEK